MDEVPEQAFSSCCIKGISCTDKELFFDIETTAGNRTYFLKILFATGKNIDSTRVSSIDFKDRDRFPLRQRVFRIGEAVIEGNSYSLFNDRWVKIK